MDFGVNARRLEGQRLGIGRYIEYLLKYWKEMLGPDDSMTLYLREPLHDDTDAWISQAFRTRVLGPRLTGLAWENLVLGPAVKGHDVLFCPSYSVPLTYRGPCVTAIHSAFEVQPDSRSSFSDWSYGLVNRLSARRADKVIVPSRSVRSDMETAYGLSPDVLVTVTEGADDSFRPVVDPEVLSATRQEYFGDDRPYVLFVGKFSERRNVPLLIDAFARMKQRTELPHRLLLMGPNVHGLPIAEQIAALGLQTEVLATNRVFARHADLMALYSAADLYAFPSTYEGASNTTVEAMACGLPVVAGRSSAIADIVGNAGLLVEDVTVEDFARAMERVLVDRSLWAALRARGLEQSLLHRWSLTAEGTLEVLRAVGAAGAGVAR